MSAVSGPDYPVVIAGGGLIGLSAAMFLAQQGVASLVVERLRGGSPLPRAAHFHLRTLELFRLAGITQGIAGRVRDGTAASAKALESAKRTVLLSKQAWEYAQKAGAQ